MSLQGVRKGVGEGVCRDERRRGRVGLGGAREHGQ